MPKALSAEKTVDKWQRRAAVAAPDYQNGVANPRVAWDVASKAGENNYKTAVTQAASQGRYGRGISDAGNQRWLDGAMKKGPGRFVEGVNVAGPSFQAAIGQVLSTIESVTLPARGPKGSPQNYQRVAPIGDALRRAFKKTA